MSGVCPFLLCPALAHSAFARPVRHSPVWRLLVLPGTRPFGVFAFGIRPFGVCPSLSGIRPFGVCPSLSGIRSSGVYPSLSGIRLFGVTRPRLVFACLASTRPCPVFAHLASTRPCPVFARSASARPCPVFARSASARPCPVFVCSASPRPRPVFACSASTRPRSVFACLAPTCPRPVFAFGVYLSLFPVVLRPCPASLPVATWSLARPAVTAWVWERSSCLEKQVKVMGVSIKGKRRRRGIPLGGRQRTGAGRSGATECEEVVMLLLHHLCVPNL